MICIIFLLLTISFAQTADYHLTIDEKSSIDKAIFQFPHSYELVKNFQSNFNLTKNHMNLILTKPIDRDYWCTLNICSCDHCSFLLELFSNQNQIPQFSTMNITINDINDHTCQFLDLQTNISLSESIQIGHRFPLTRAIDSDSGNNGKLKFEILNHQNDFQLDVISLSNNEYAIYGIVKTSLDRERTSHYEFIVEGRDFGFPQAKYNRTKIQINIIDENDNAPLFNQTEYSIESLPENTPVGSELIKVSATDADEGLNGLIHYSIVNPPMSSSFPFEINSTTGVIRLRSSLDYESTHSYRFLIRASDSGIPQSLFTDTWLSISLKDINDCPVDILFLPNRRFQYENQTLFIYENTQIENLTLGYLRLFDRDSIQTKLSVSLILLDKVSHQNYQLILSNQINTYILIAKDGIFDREIQDEINLRFVTTDSLLTSIFDLKIDLIDLNDNPSEFSSNPLKFSVEELANYQMMKYPIEKYQFTIGYLNAFDRDQGENALNTYELEENSLVKIDSTTGRLYLIQPLDREQIQKIELKAKAINIAQPKWITDVNIHIHVTDVNDNIPRCSTSFQRLSLPENYSIEKPLIKIIGIDQDNDLNGTINYSFRTNSSWPFHISKQTGEIYSKQEFDYESNWKSFLLTIDLEDNGITIQNQYRNACQIEIFLEDINDNRPEIFDENQTKIFLDINRSIDNHILLLNFSDKDSGLNGKIKSTLQSIESNINLNFNQSLFYLNSNGSLYILSPINQVSLFKLDIFLEDYGYPIQQNLVEIQIAFGNSFDPKYSSFEKVQYYFQEKSSQTNSFAFLFGLIIFFVSLICLIAMTIICICIRKHRQRHKTAMISRNKLLCSSSQQLTTSNSTVISNGDLSSNEHQQNIRSLYWTEKSFLDQNSSIDSSSPESHTYKILHIPTDIQHDEKEKVDNISCDHGYHESYQTGTSSSSSSPQSDQFSSQTSIRRDYLSNQLPYFVTKCKSLTEGFIIEMNVDGSDEDGR